MPKYVKCPRCDLNYMLEGEEYCDVCKAELKKAPPLVFAVDDDDEDYMELCPVCHRNFIKHGETMCEDCLKESERDEERDEEDDDSWKEYIDQDTPEEDDEE